MPKNPTIPVVTEPQLIDRALFEIQGRLTNALPWLDQAYGRASVLKELKDRRTVVYPAVYAGKKDYLRVFPDGHLGNFSFFVVDDGEEIEYFERSPVSLSTKLSLIFWLDFRSVYPNDWTARTVEHPKAEAIEALRLMSLRFSSVRLLKAYVDASNVYKGFTDKEIEEQYLMRPYGGFRLELSIKYQENQNC